MAQNGASSIDWKSEYSALLNQLGLDPDANGGERKEPRIKFNPPEQTLLVRVGGLVGALNDISASGASFYATALLTKNREVKLIFDDKFLATITIVSSLLLGENSLEAQDIFRTGGQFVERDDGYRCVVLALRVYSRVS